MQHWAKTCRAGIPAHTLVGKNRQSGWGFLWCCGGCGRNTSRRKRDGKRRENGEKGEAEAEVLTLHCTLGLCTPALQGFSSRAAHSLHMGGPILPPVWQVRLPHLGALSGRHQPEPLEVSCHALPASVWPVVLIHKSRVCVRPQQESGNCSAHYLPGDQRQTLCSGGEGFMSVNTCLS